jgi:hypothetical protein
MLHTLLGRLGAPVDELEVSDRTSNAIYSPESIMLADSVLAATHVRALLDKVLGDLNQLLEAFGHDGRETSVG